MWEAREEPFVVEVVVLMADDDDDSDAGRSGNGGSGSDGWIMDWGMVMFVWSQ